MFVKKQLFAIVLLLPLAVFSQKNVDLDRFKFTSQFRTLPAYRLDSTYRTYNIVIEGNKLMQAYVDGMSPEKSVILEGWRRLDADGHLNIRVKLDELLPESFSVKERIEVIKDRNGKETGSRKLYHQEVVYTFSSFAEVNDYKGAHIKNIILADRGYKQVYSSPEFAVRGMAEGYFLLNTFNISAQLYKNCVNRAMRYLSEQLTDNFGYGITSITEHMWIIDSKKHPEYMAHRNAFLVLKEALFSIDANKPLDGIREQAEPAIQYFESIKKKYTSSSKHDRKIRYASYYNLAVLYYYLDDPQSMQREASGLILNDFDARDGKNLEAGAIRLKNLFQDTRMSSRHFAIDTATLRGPFEKEGVIATK